ncbi:MAG TPA: hypothetical protein VK961_11095 [Chthoniobacter sp.]|nr:hypothetical protein [Chthoniobacter sp.]
MNFSKYLPLLAAFGLTTTGAFAQLVNPHYSNYQSVLGGTSAEYQWGTYTSETRPAGVAASVSGISSQWPLGIAPISGAGIVFRGNQSFGSETTDFLSGASPNSGGIYTFFSATHFQIQSTSPLAGTKTLVLQIAAAEGQTSGGSATPFLSSPTLTLTTSSGTFIDIAPQYSQLSEQMQQVIFGGPQNIDRYDFQWDLTSIPSFAGNVTGYTINWQEGFHAILFGQDVTESSTVRTTNALVPEPSAGVAMVGGLGLLLGLRRLRGVTFA